MQVLDAASSVQHHSHLELLGKSSKRSVSASTITPSSHSDSLTFQGIVSKLLLWMTSYRLQVVINS